MDRQTLLTFWNVPLMSKNLSFHLCLSLFVYIQTHTYLSDLRDSRQVILPCKPVIPALFISSLCVCRMSVCLSVRVSVIVDMWRSEDNPDQSVHPHL